MDLVARKDGPEKPTADDIMEVLNMKPSPAIKDSSFNRVYSYFWNDKFELTVRVKVSLRNRLLHFFDKFAFAKGLGEAVISKFLTDNNLPVSDTNTNIMTFATKVESNDFFEFKARFADSTHGTMIADDLIEKSLSNKIRCQL